MNDLVFLMAWLFCVLYYTHQIPNLRFGVRMRCCGRSYSASKKMLQVSWGLSIRRRCRYGVLKDAAETQAASS
jgi:hypothetical protein